jgi:hypothetical protein
MGNVIILSHMRCALFLTFSLIYSSAYVVKNVHTIPACVPATEHI